MLLIDHFIEKSDIHGLGVFAAEAVKEGEKIWEFNTAIDIVIEFEILKTLPPHAARRIEMRAEYYPEEKIFILGADGDSYMNHSDNPNLKNFGREGYASRDMEIGDEITCDYSSTKTVLFSGGHSITS